MRTRQRSAKSSTTTEPVHASAKANIIANARSMNNRDNVAGGATSSIARKPVTANSTRSGPLNFGASKTGRTASTIHDAKIRDKIMSATAARINAIQRQIGVSKISTVT